MKINKWYDISGEQSDVVVSVRVRFARNLSNYPFPNKMNLQQKNEVINKVSDAVLKSNSTDFNDFKLINMDKISKIEAYSMVERYLISPEFAEKPEGRALLLKNDESVSIMINEEDHIRIQVMSCGLSFTEAFDIATKIDTLIEGNVTYAFDKNLGYLTECPTNLGTGMRASAMLHIPALEMIGAISQLSNTISKVGLIMRGTYGEGSKAKCSLYQISNQITLGISEITAIENLQGIVNQIIDRERKARKSIEQNSLHDAVFRSFGILKYARLLTSSEFMELISRVRLGVGMGLIQDVSVETINNLILNCQSASIQNSCGKSLEVQDRDKLRADIVREKLN